MKKLLVAVVLIIVFGAGAAYAGSLWPDGVSRWIDEECGLVCYEWSDGSGDCYPCQSDICQIVSDSVVETFNPPRQDPTENPPPTQEPTEEPTLPPPPTEEPPPLKHRCNSGRGNGSEGDPDCDPGNSGGHNQGGD